MKICLFYQRLYKQTSVLMSRSKYVACVTLCPSFSSNSAEYMYLKDFEISHHRLLRKGHL